MNPPKLSKRLDCAASFVRPNSFVADVGTDHAYLPIALAAAGRICGGVVSDIHKGPIDRATAHIREWGMEDRLTPVLCDGLAEIEPYAPDDILILGMGGELIADILRRAPWTKRPGVRLILQPMTHPELLRRFLLSESYTILDEALVKEEKIYQILCVEYSGAVSVYNDTELLFGRENIRRGGALLDELLTHWTQILTVRREGKLSAGADSSEEDKLLQQIGELRHDRT
ncbi:MAG: SAM-dependent methyltransferase [Clostridia bacterium]|nr:SAM-dependent methyltransferase [Clostridia bacterium]